MRAHAQLWPPVSNCRNERDRIKQETKRTADEVVRIDKEAKKEMARLAEEMKREKSEPASICECTNTKA